MAKHHRSFRALGALALVCSGCAGCHNATLCEPTSPPLGQLVTSGISEQYLAEVDKMDGDVPHIACEAETTIITPRVYVRESEDGNCQSTGKYCLGGSDNGYRNKTVPMNLPMDQTAVESKSAILVVQSEFRIVGIGQGITIEDCGETALRACNAGHDAYFDQQRGIRPLASGCRVAESQNMCAPGGRRPRAPVAATPPEPTLSPEERLPATWIARLGDVKRRPLAIRALIHFHSDAMLRSRHNAGDPVVKGVLDEIVEPLANVYVDGNLERSTRVLVIRFLAETRDPRAGRAFIHACHGFATATGPDEEDVQHASAAIADLRFEEAAPALGEAFAKVEAGTTKGSAASKNIRVAMMQLKSAAWKPVLLEKLGAPLDRPPHSANAGQVARYQTQIFWQQTSTELLGAFGDASAAEPLLKVLMERGKAEIAGPALIGIVKIGKSAVPVLTDVLAGRDAQMVDFAKNKAAEASGNAKSSVMASAVALGAIGRADARAPMIQALRASDNETNRAVIARELTALPANAESIKAFQAGYAKVPTATRI
jgi:HEAT repeat protein